MADSMLERDTVPPGVDARIWREVGARDPQAPRDGDRAPQPVPWPDDAEDGFEPSVVRGID